MLGNTNAVANVAVKDLNRAQRFYEDVIGLTPIERVQDEVIVYKSGDTKLNVYRSAYAGTNKATAVTWSVGNQLDDIVRALKARGVSFEHYDMPNTKVEGDVHVTGDVRVAWFKDPDGNILNLIDH